MRLVLSDLTLCQIIIVRIKMEDSIELSDHDIAQQGNQEINFFVSPNNSIKKQKQELLNTGSQESLAYSSETHVRYQNIDRSPVQIQIPNFETSEKPAVLKKMIRAAKVAIDKQPTLKPIRSQRSLQPAHNIGPLLIQDPMREDPPSFIKQDRRKTITKKEQTNLDKKCKQLEYALQVEVMGSEQLRIKVSILTELLQHKLKQSQLSYFLGLKNSSKMKNIDVFLQLQQTQTKLKQCQLTIQSQKQQIQSLVEQCMLRTSRKQNINTNNCDPVTQIEALLEQKQSLFSYIEEVKKEYNDKNVQNLQIKQELSRCQERYDKFVNVERSKLHNQIKERTEQIRNIKEEADKLKMERNLIEISYQNQIEELKNTHLQHNKIKKIETRSVQTATVDFHSRVGCTQTDFTQQEQVLKAEVRLLKSERDYYIQQFKKRANESSQNYLLKLQIKALQASHLP